MAIDIKDLELLKKDIEKTSQDIIEKMNTQADELKAHGGTLTVTADQLKKLEADYDKQQKDLSGIIAEFKEYQAEGKRPNFGSNVEAKSVGELFLESDQFKQASQMGLKTTNPFEIKSFFDTKATIDSTTGVTLRGTYRPFGQTPLYFEQPLAVRDLMNVQTMNGGSIEYVQETGFTNNAAPQVEGSAKAESALTFALKTAPVRTIAHFIPATNQIMSDAPMLRNYIDTRLTFGLKVAEEGQILYGSGTGVNLEGLMVNTGTQDQGLMTGAGVTKIDWIRKALTKTRITGYGATGIVLNPVDWESIELAKGSDARYIFTSVNDGGIMRLFRVPVVESNAMVANDFLVGAFGLGAQLLDREQANVRVAEQHADFFTRNMVAVLAEERLAMPIYRPQAFVKGKFA